MRIGLAQTNITWEDKDSNKITCVKFMHHAMEKNVDLVIFPEMTLTGFTMNAKILGDIHKETVEWFSEQAKVFNLNIAFGYPAYINDKGENHLSIVSSLGEELANYTKIHPFSYGTESKYYSSGEKILFTNIGEFTISPFICYDLRFPEIFQIASRKANLIIIIANWPETRKDHWITLLKARAIENQCYIAGVNRVGSDTMLTYSGDSMIIDPLGNIIAHESRNEALVCADIDSEMAAKVRESFKLKADRKEVLYASYYNLK